MAYEPELLPPDTDFCWEKKRLRCIQQGDAAFFIHYNVPLYPTKVGMRGLSTRRGATIGCSFIGLANKETARYLGVGLDTVKTNLKDLYKKLGIQAASDSGAYPYHSFRTLSRLAARRAVELGHAAELTHDPNPIIFDFVNGFLQGRSAAEVGAPHDLSAKNVSERLQYWREKAGFETTAAYALHLLAAGKVGKIACNPSLMENLPALKPFPLVANRAPAPPPVSRQD